MLIISNFLLWIVVLLQLVAIVALGRRVRMRGVSGGAGSRDKAAKPGWQARVLPPVGAATGGRPVPDLAEDGEAERPTMLLYMTAECSVGKRLIPDADLMARTEGMRLILARDEEGGASMLPPRPAARTRSATARRPSRAGRTRTSATPLPYVMVIDRLGGIAAQGQASSRADLARLLANASLDDPRPRAGGAAAEPQSS